LAPACHRVADWRPDDAHILVDARGNVRFQRISSDPFLEVEFVKTEAARVNGLLKRK